ncbi:MAG: hypothetical protein ACREPW_04360 [Candidatus Binataceae bacterium]
MIPQVKVPDLAEAIAAHASAVLAGDIGAAEGCVTPTALEAYRLAIKEAMRLGPFDRYTAPALARLGTQYIAKVRFAGARGGAQMQVRWARGGEGRWLIAEAEYFPPGRTPWTRLERPRPAAWQGPMLEGKNR